MANFKISTYKVFLVYLGVLFIFFLYAGITGMRVLGDDKEEYKPEGLSHNSTGSGRVYRTYHK